MKKFILILFAALLGTFAASAQAGKKCSPEMIKEIREFKVKFIAQEIGLRDDQRTRFVETYNSLMEEEGILFGEMRAIKKRLKNRKDVSDAEYNQVSQAMTENKEKSLALEKKYDALFSKFLSAKQVYEMKDAEMKFRRKMEQMYADKKRGGAKKHKKTKNSR